MVKLKSLLFESKILIPRRTPKEREKTLIAEQYRIIQRYIRDGCQGNLDLRNSPIKILPDNLTHVGGNLDLTYSKIEDLNNLERVDGNLMDLSGILYLKSLGKLKFVGGDLDLSYSEIEDLNNLEIVNGYLDLYYCKKLKSLGKLKYVASTLYLTNSNILKIMSKEDIRRRVQIKKNIIT